MPEPASKTTEAAAAERFQNDLLTRGEAVPLTVDGKLPLAATHAVVKNAEGVTTVKRVRAKYF